MNKWIGMGRLTADPEVRYSQGENAICIARYRLAVDRRNSRDSEQNADFISCVAFGKQGEFAEKYLHKGMKIAVEGRIQAGSYTDRETGKKVYTTEIVVEGHHFCESKGGGQQEAPQDNYGGFMNIPDGLDDELPFPT